jgi:hypothetical protein
MENPGPAVTGYPAAHGGGGDFAETAAAHAADRALEELAVSSAPSPRRRSGEAEVPDWWPGQERRIDAAGVARRPESWLVRSRFAIACTVACLALIAAVVLGTIRRGPVGSAPWGQAMAKPHPAGHVANDAAASSEAPVPETKSHKKSSAEKHSHSSGEASRSGKHRGK